MKYIIQEKDNLQILHVDSLLYELENKRLLNKLTGLMNDGKSQIVVSLNQVDYINSTGLRFLISVLTKSRNVGGDMALIHVPQKVKKLLVMTKLQSIFPIFDDMEKLKSTNVFKPQIAISDSE